MKSKKWREKAKKKERNNKVMNCKECAYIIMFNVTFIEHANFSQAPIRKTKCTTKTCRFHMQIISEVTDFFPIYRQQDPQKAIPKGTFLSIIITGVVYLLMVWTSGATLLRDAIGPVGAILFGNHTTNQTATPTIELVTSCVTSNKSCEYGLMNDNGVSKFSYSLYSNLNLVHFLSL